MKASEEPGGERVIFLGTAGARVMVANQILSSGGIWLDLSGTEILLDPGPGTLVQATKRKLKPSKLRAIILSHRHLDHAADANIMIEAMTEGGLKKKGALFAPQDALEEDPVVLHYLRSALKRIEFLQEGQNYQIDGISFKTPLRHSHSVETYGLTFQTPEHTFSFIMDSKYFDKLCTSYKDSQLLIINTVRLEPSPYEHLSAREASKIIAEIKPRLAILTHFGMTMWRAKPWEVAKRIQEETGIRVLTARDGLSFDLTKLEQGAKLEPGTHPRSY